MGTDFSFKKSQFFRATERLVTHTSASRLASKTPGPQELCDSVLVKSPRNQFCQSDYLKFGSFAVF